MVKSLLSRSLFLVVIAISFLTLLNVKSYFHRGIPYTHDGENHLARFANYKLALKEGQLPPRFAPNLMNHYGYPVFNYNYPLANLASVPFSFFKVSYVMTFKIIMTLSVAGGLLGVWLWLDALQFSRQAKMAGLILWGITPYLVTSILYRGNIGEVMAVSLVPWILLKIEKLATPKTRVWSWTLVTLSLVMTAFLLSHNVTAVFGVPLVIGYAALRFRTKQTWLQLVSSGLLAVGLSLWFWLPALIEKSEVVLDRAGLSQNYAHHFPTFKQLLFSPIGFGFSYPGVIDSLSMAIGLVQVVALLVATLLWFRYATGSFDRHQAWVKWVILGGWGLVILQLKVSQGLWEVLPMVRFIQFPWRLTLFLMPVTTLACAWLWDKIGEKGRRVLIALILIQVMTMSRLQAVDHVYKTNQDYEAFTQSTTTLNENMPTSFKYLQIGDWQPTAIIGAGNGQVIVESWKGSDRKYRVIASTAVTILEPTMRFSGWLTTVQSNSATAQVVEYIDDETIQGRIAYHLKPGEYEVRSRFTQSTWPRLVGNSVSGLTWLGLIGISIWLGFKNRRKGQHV
jgi:hypothetical protein